MNVEHRADGIGGFQLVFRTGRTARDPIDEPLMGLDALQPFSRVTLAVVVDGIRHELMSGGVLQRQISSSMDAGGSLLTITGQDVSLFMDRVELRLSWPSLGIVQTLLTTLARYAPLGVIPVVIPHGFDVSLSPLCHITQSGTDLAFVQQQAESLGYVVRFYPGPAAGTTIAYVGPRIPRGGISQPALSWMAGGQGTVRSLHLTHNADTPTTVVGLVSVGFPPGKLPIPPIQLSRQPMASRPTLRQIGPLARIKGPSKDTAGDWWSSARAAQQTILESTSSSATATGELDGLAYGRMLHAGQPVALRGAGESFDGAWFVDKVSHTLARGDWKQEFALRREGLGALRQRVRL